MARQKRRDPHRRLIDPERKSGRQMDGPTGHETNRQSNSIFFLRTRIPSVWLDVSRVTHTTRHTQRIAPHHTQQNASHITHHSKSRLRSCTPPHHQLSSFCCVFARSCSPSLFSLVSLRPAGINSCAGALVCSVAVSLRNNVRSRSVCWCSWLCWDRRLEPSPSDRSTHWHSNPEHP